MFDGSFLLDHVCWIMFARSRLLGHMLGHVCWVMCAGSCLLGYVCWVRFEGSILLGRDLQSMGSSEIIGTFG